MHNKKNLKFADLVIESDDGGVNIGARESDQGFREERENEKFWEWEIMVERGGGHKCLAEPAKLGSMESRVLKRVQKEFETEKGLEGFEIGGG
ncbi:hypothetical protein JHK82_050328 [Glycine max]|nr:hypothetical protein JHK86_050175 [Glycine max]KAG4924471.1 hypothetical protein JHK87_050011 [Glycine soja]KAG5091550.1 hypothetical protein JHK82_050328 [Glycine max]KAG5094644.1 hypothetical protein JHK84_050232 [Glycine max]